MTDTSAVKENGTAALVIARPVGLLRPVAEPQEVISAQEATRDLVAKALMKGRDFGVIPGTKKSTLLKAGAERIVLAFGCFARFHVVEREADHNIEIRYSKKEKKWRNRFKGDKSYDIVIAQGISYGLYRYVVECEIVHRESGAVVGGFQGSCSSMESKYIDRPRDCENTVLKMAEKRALVGAVLTTFGLSDQFTQDVEDMPREMVESGQSPNEDDDIDAPELKEPERTLTWAQAYAIPFKGELSGVQLGTRSEKEWRKFRDWAESKIKEAGASGDEPSALITSFRAACQLLIDNVEKDQGNLALDSTNGAGPKAVPGAGEQEEREREMADGPAATDQDDDVPISHASAAKTADAMIAALR